VHRTAFPAASIAFGPLQFDLIPHLDQLWVFFAATRRHQSRSTTLAPQNLDFSGLGATASQRRQYLTPSGISAAAAEGNKMGDTNGSS
jgi:hypothetical protein